MQGISVPARIHDEQSNNSNFAISITVAMIIVCAECPIRLTGAQRALLSSEMTPDFGYQNCQSVLVENKAQSFYQFIRFDWTKTQLMTFRGFLLIDSHY